MRFRILLLALVLHQSCLLCNAYPPTYSGEPPSVGDSGGGGKDTLTSSVKYITKSSARAAARAAEASSPSSSSSSTLSTTFAPAKTTTDSLPDASEPLHVQPAFVYEAALPTQDDATATAAGTAEHDGESSKKIIGSSVVTSVSVILNGNEPQFMDAIGVKVPKPLPSLQVASPINLLNPDRYEFYTFDDNGELVKRLMTLQEIQSIVANGDGEGPSIIHTAPILEHDPEKNVQDIVNSVQNVLNKQVESTNNSTTNAVPQLDTPDVSSSWSMILPAIFGNTGDDIFPPQKPQQINMTPDTDLLETSTKQPIQTTKRPKPPKRKPSQKRKPTTSTTEMPQTPQIVQEDLAPNESVYTGMEQYQSIASNMQDFDAFSTMNMQPIYHKIQPAESETTTRRVFVNNHEVIQTPAPLTVKPEELPEASGKKPTHTQHKHAPPHRRRPGASNNKQKIKKRPQFITTTKVPPTAIPVITTTTTTTAAPTTTPEPTTTTTTTTTTTPAPITIPITLAPTTLLPELITTTPVPATIAPLKKKKKPTRQPIPHYPNGASNKPHLGSQKRKPQPTPHHRPRPTSEQHHPQLEKQPQQQDQHLQQLHHPTQQKEHQKQQPKPQEQQPPQQIHHDSVVDSTVQQYQHVNHHKQRPRPTKLTTTTPATTPSTTTTTTTTTTPVPTIPTTPALPIEPIVPTTPAPIEASLVVASYSGLETAPAVSPNLLPPTHAPVSAYPVPVFDLTHTHQPQTQLDADTEETETGYLKINPLLSLSMIQQQQHQQQQQQQQLPLIHSDEDLNTKLSFDQIMLSLKQDEEKDVKKQEVNVTHENIKEPEIVPVKYDSAENMQTLEEMVDKLKKPVPTTKPPILPTTAAPLVTQNAETSPSSMLLKGSTAATTVKPTAAMIQTDTESSKLDADTSVVSVDELKPVVKVAATPHTTTSAEAMATKTANNEEEIKAIIKEPATSQLQTMPTKPELTTQLPETSTNHPKLTTSDAQFTTRTPEISTTKTEILATEPVHLTTMMPPATTTADALTTISDTLLELESTKLPANTLQTETTEQQEHQEALNSTAEFESLEQKPAEDQAHVVHFEPLYAEVQEPILTDLTTTELPEAQTSSNDVIEDSSTAEPAVKTDLTIDEQDSTTEFSEAETVVATTNANLRLPVYVNIPQDVDSIIAEDNSQTEQPLVIDLVQHLNPNIVQPTEKISMIEFQTQAATVASAIVGATNIMSTAADVPVNSSETKDELELLMSDVIQQITNDQQTYKLPPVEENANRLSNFAQFNSSFLLKQGLEEVVQEAPQSNEDGVTSAETATESTQHNEMKQTSQNNAEIVDEISTATAEQLVGTTAVPSKQNAIKMDDEHAETVEDTTATMPTNADVLAASDKLTTLEMTEKTEMQEDKVDEGDKNEKLSQKPISINQAIAEQVTANASIERIENKPHDQMESIAILTPVEPTSVGQNLENVGAELDTPNASQLIKIVTMDNKSEKQTEKSQESEELKFSKLESSTDKTIQAEVNSSENNDNEEATEKSSEDLSDTSTENIAILSDETATTETSEESSSASEDKADEVISTHKISSDEQHKSEESNESQSATEEDNKEDAITNATQPQPQYTVEPNIKDEKQTEDEEGQSTSPPETDVKLTVTEKPLTTEAAEIITPSKAQNSAVTSSESDVSANVELVSSSQQLESGSVEESTEMPTKIPAVSALSNTSASDELTTERIGIQSATETSTEDMLSATIVDDEQSQEAIEEDPYIKLGELTAKPTVVKPQQEQESTLPVLLNPSMEAEEEQTTFEHMENNYEAIVNGHQGMSTMENYDSTPEQDEEDEEDQGGFEATTISSESSSSTKTSTQSSGTPKLTSTTTSTTSTTQLPLIVSTTTQPITTPTTTKRLNTLKPVSYYKQPIFNAYNQPEPSKLQTYSSNISPPAVQQLQQRPMHRPPALSNLMHTSSLATRPPVKLEPSSGHSKGLEASVANLDEDLLQFGQLCNELAFSYWKSITSEKISSARSLVISPFALTSMLSMVFLGARGGTSGEMNEVLRLDDMVTFNPHLVFKNITESVEKATDSDIATAAFVREIFSDRSNGKILQFFKEKTQQLYAGHVEEVNFHVVNDIIRRRTNLLIKRHTMGKVLEYLRTNSVWVNGPLATISANLFQTDCKHGSTHDRDGEMFFQVHPTVRQRRLVPIPAVLYKSGFTAGYEPKLDATVVAFGRIEDTVSTIYVMPGHQSSISPIDNLDRLERELIDLAFSGNAWSNVLTSVMDRPGMEVQLPRFSHRSFVNASLGLQKMGLKGLFKSDFADLRGLTGSSNRDIYLSDMIQINTFSTCGEEKISDHHHVEMYPAPPLRKRNKDVDANDEDEFDSSEAIIDFGSLVHESALGRGFYDDLLDPKFLELPLPLRPRQARVPDTPRLRFDKPFLYFVRHNPTGMILFMGRFNPRLLP